MGHEPAAPPGGLAADGVRHVEAVGHPDAEQVEVDTESEVWLEPETVELGVRRGAAEDMDDGLTEILDLVFEDGTGVSYAEHADVGAVKVNLGTGVRWT